MTAGRPGLRKEYRVRLCPRPRNDPSDGRADAPIDRQAAPGVPVGLVGSEVEGGPRDVLGPASKPERMGLLELLDLSARPQLGEVGAIHVRLDVGGADAVDAYALVRVIERHALREVHHRGLGHAVWHMAALRLQATHGRDVDDGAAPAPELGEGGPRAEKHAHEIGIERAPEFFGLTFLDRHPSEDSARVVDQDVELAEALDRAADDGSYIGLDGGIADESQRLAACVLDGGAGRFEECPPSAADGHAGTLAGEAKRDSAAEATPTPGDEGYPILETHGMHATPWKSCCLACVP